MNDSALESNEQLLDEMTNCREELEADLIFAEASRSGLGGSVVMRSMSTDIQTLPGWWVLCTSFLVRSQFVLSPPVRSANGPCISCPLVKSLSSC